MMEHGVGVITVGTYAVQKVEADYFEGTCQTRSGDSR
jgi:restriction endonuclease Mrr